MAHCSLIMDFCCFYYLTSSYLCSLRVTKGWTVPYNRLVPSQRRFFVPQNPPPRVIDEVAFLREVARNMFRCDAAASGLIEQGNF